MRAPESSDEENEASKRKYAELIIAGEYQSAVVTLIDSDGIRHVWYDGGQAQCIGLTVIAKEKMLKQAIQDDE